MVRPSDNGSAIVKMDKLAYIQKEVGQLNDIHI